MSAPGSQPPFWLALLAIAVLGLVWQLYRAYRLGRRALSFPHAAFWISAAAWTSLGLYAQAPGLCPQPPVLWRWVLPAGGLLATALLRWIVGVLPHLMAEAEALPEHATRPAGVATQNDRPEEGDLDAEDLQLLARLRFLLGKRAADLMVPVNATPTVPADAGVDTVLATLTRSGARRVAVIDAASSRAVGVIDGLALMLALIDRGSDAAGPPAAATDDGLPAQRAATTGGFSARPAATARARQLCRPVPVVPSWRPAHEALETLRTGGAGMTAVVDSRDRVQGFLAWEPLFRALLGRPLHGGRP
jgi:CBS domain containing-hemolysin-like protein